MARLLLAMVLASCSPQAASRRMHVSQSFSLEKGVSEYRQRDPSTSCVPLKNKGSFSTVEVSVGTPSQKFDVIADTGSDSLIVASCSCVDRGHCLNESKCFHESGSHTFVAQKDYLELTITFGSGPVDTFVATDSVSLGNISITMHDSLLLMTDKRLDGNLELEGILGLGLPPSGDLLPSTVPTVGQGLLELAGVERFSVCFNDRGRDGVLRLGNKVPMDKPLGGVGSFHWGVDFRGVALGGQEGSGASVRMSFCDEASMPPDQQTPCGAMVDSGTTLIMAPVEHLGELFSRMCEAWPQCHNNPIVQALDIAATPKNLNEQSDPAKATLTMIAKSKALLNEIATCNLTGLPPLQFFVRGSDGTNQTLELPPHDYIMETVREKTLIVRKWLGGLIPVDYEIPDPAGGLEKACIPAFATNDYLTKGNGPVWIFGTPFFYRYTVSYDRSIKPPALSFDATSCDECDGAPASSTASLLQEGRARRVLDTDPRFPRHDIERGL